MPRLRSSLAVVVSLAAVGGCLASTAPEVERPSFVVAPVGSPNAPEGATNPPTVVPRDGGLDVRGVMTTPDPCQAIDAEVVRDGGAVVLTLTATWTVTEDSACIASLGEFAWAADVAALAPGTYRVAVVYRYPGTGWPTTTVLDAEVEVP